MKIRPQCANSLLPGDPLCVINLTIIWSIRVAGITDISGGKIRNLEFASWRRHTQLIINTI